MLETYSIITSNIHDLRLIIIVVHITIVNMPKKSKKIG